MFSIANIIYGIPITKEIHEIIPEHTDVEPFDLGFEMRYSGSAEYQPGFCGVLLCIFDESDENLLLSSLQLQPTPEQKANAEAKIAELPSYIREVSLPVGVYLVWSTS